MLFYNSLAHPTVMMRRSVLDPVAAYNVEYRNIEQDYDLFSRLSLVTRLANLAEPLLLYRVWGGNVSHNADRANHVLRDFVVRHGIEIDLDDATALLGLARDRFPSEPERIRRMASIIRRMRSQYVKRFASDPRDVRAIDQDAAMRLWLLAALSVGRSPWLGLSLASAATRIRPSSIAPFASKVATRLQQRARM